jgi:hypothetical protein
MFVPKFYFVNMYLQLKIATIADHGTPLTYTIMPVNEIYNDSEKEEFDHNLNSHVIRKRDTNEEEYEIGLDYLEINEGIK